MRFAILTLIIVLFLLGACASENPAAIGGESTPLEPSLTPTASESPSPTLIPTFTSSPTPSPTITPTPSPTPSPTETPTTTPSPTITYTPSPEPTITPSTSSLAIPRLDLTPGRPIPYLETFRMVTYYGSPKGWGLGILGESAREYMTWDLKRLALEYQALSPDRFVLPTYHMVTTVADGYPGEDENYNHHVEMEVIEDWIAAAEEGNVAVIIDLQLAHADLQEEFDRIKHLLHRPHVHLALDPEFIMEEGQLPGQHLGKISAEQVNDIQAQLEEIALAVGLNRVLIVHQFEDKMFPDKENLIDYPHVELVIDADGVSSIWNKLYDYNQYVGEPGFEYGGIKIFFKYDAAPLLTPLDVMYMEPVPAVIVHQ